MQEIIYCSVRTFTSLGGETVLRRTRQDSRRS
jgi:hypothetical protein